MKKKSKEQLIAENDALRRFRVAEGFVSIINTLIKWGAICFIAYCFTLSIQSLSGKSTTADIKIAADVKANLNQTDDTFSLSDLKLGWVPWFLIGSGGILYGARQRHLRKTTVEHIHGRIRTHELEVDPGRSSSKLTPRGDTRPEDR